MRRSLYPQVLNLVDYQYPPGESKNKIKYDSNEKFSLQ